MFLFPLRCLLLLRAITLEWEGKRRIPFSFMFVQSPAFPLRHVTFIDKPISSKQTKSLFPPRRKTINLRSCRINNSSRTALTLCRLIVFPLRFSLPALFRILPARWPIALSRGKKLCKRGLEKIQVAKKEKNVIALALLFYSRRKPLRNVS